ncbi:MAG: hypothetical protein R3C28_01580 [Pirellulaceae bacterium]
MQRFTVLRRLCRIVLLVLAVSSSRALTAEVEVAGIYVVPHQFSDQLKWRRPPEPELSARTELFVRNGSTENLVLPNGSLTWDQKLPQTLVNEGQWAWHGTPDSWLEEQTSVPPGSLLALEWNGRSAAWGIGSRHSLQMVGVPNPLEIDLAKQDIGISSVSFIAPDDSVYPQRMVVHVANMLSQDVTLAGYRLWLAQPDESVHVFYASDLNAPWKAFGERPLIQSQSRSGFEVEFERLPLTYCVLEVMVLRTDGSRQSLWAKLRIKPDRFDISGGWVASNVGGTNSLTMLPYLKTLKRMHINTGQIENVSGYTDNAELYSQYPIKLFNRLQPVSRFEADQELAKVHAVEFLGEPQYGGGRPVPPQEVYDQLLPYQTSRLPTTVTFSEEHNWRYYAGISDFPHYDAYRVTAPAADAWRSYDRWNGKQIRWAAPLETIGDMTRSLKHHHRPRPIAYWAQGAHHDWRGYGRQRSSPNPDELAAQAYQGLANHITSLYWFNLSIESLAKFPDLIEPITRINREIRMLDSLMVEGDATFHQRIASDGSPDLDVNMIAGPEAAVIFVQNLDYSIDETKNEFIFSNRDVTVSLPMPAWFGSHLVAFKVNADGVQGANCSFSSDLREVTITDTIRVAGIYVVTTNPDLRTQLAAKHQALVETENVIDFHPGVNPDDTNSLVELAKDPAGRRE